MSRKFRPFYVASVAVMGVGLLGSVLVPKAEVAKSPTAPLAQSYEEPAATLETFLDDGFDWSEGQISSRAPLAQLMSTLPSASLMNAR